MKNQKNIQKEIKKEYDKGNNYYNKTEEIKDKRIK